MLIENPDAFKTWLTSILEPLCEADPAALAKYVYALVKKDKPLDDLRDGMVDQLDVFLQQETKPFVELLFKTLESQEYLSEAMAPAAAGNAAVSAPAALPTAAAAAAAARLQPVAKEAATAPAEAKTANNHQDARPDNKDRRDGESSRSEGERGGRGSRAGGGGSGSEHPKHRIVLNRTTKFTPATVPKEKPAYATEQTLVKVIPDLLEDSLNEPLPSRTTRRDKKSDSDKDERRRRPYRSRSPAGRSRSRSWERARPPPPSAAPWRNRSPPPQYQTSRYRRSRSGSPPPPRSSRYRNRSPPPGTAASDVQQPRSRSRSRERLLSPPPGTMLRDRLDRLSRSRDRDRSTRPSGGPRRGGGGGGRPCTPPPVPGEPLHHSMGPQQQAAFAPAQTMKKRCRDFDEKGYCMRGDLCQFDHGLDPVVLEDSSLSRVLALPMGAMPAARPAPGLLGEYNPLAPDIWSRGRVRYNAPPPPHQLQRELIPIQTIRPEDMHSAMSLRMVTDQQAPPLPPQQPPPPATSLPPAPLTAGGKPPYQGMPYSVPPPALPNHHNKKKQFDFNRLGPNRHHGNKGMGGNSSLELKKVPHGLNDIMHLNNHFCKFGKIVNIQVCYENDPEAALITFSSHTEANIAYKSTEAVLNNRFIKVFWHNAESKQENVPPGQRAAPKERPAVQTNVVQHQTNGGGHKTHNKVLINKDNQKITNTALAEAKQLQLEQQQKAAAAASGEAAQVGEQEPSKGAAALPTPAAVKDKPDAFPKESAANELAILVKRQGEGAAKIASDLRCRKQQLLDKQLQNQKSLLERLGAADVTEVQRKEMMLTIKAMQETIEKTRKEIMANPKPLGSMATNHTGIGHLKKGPRNKDEAQKEILDAELDLYTKQQEGQDVSDLQRKVLELRRQQLSMRPAPHSRRLVAQSRAAVRVKYQKMLSSGRGNLFVNQSVDHRPRSLLISGYEADEQLQVLLHFEKYGDVVEKVADSSTPSLWLQYRTRKEAEMAMLMGKQFNDRTLSVTWVSQASMLMAKPASVPLAGGAAPPAAPATTPAGAPPTQQAEEKKEPTQREAEMTEEHTTSAEDIDLEVGDASLSEDILLQDDEEEEEDGEDRSWRR